MSEPKTAVEEEQSLRKSSSRKGSVRRSHRHHRESGSHRRYRDEGYHRRHRDEDYHRRKRRHRRPKKEEPRLSDLLKEDYVPRLILSNSDDNVSVRGYDRRRSRERRKSVAFSKSKIQAPQSARKKLTPLESLSGLKAFSVNAKIRTFTVKVGLGYIRGCY